MRDGAPPRSSRVARQFLNRHFANRWIGRGGPIARSPDSSPLDFHLWGHLNSIVRATSIEHAEILRNGIEQGSFATNSRNSRNDGESNQMNDKTRAGLSSNAIKTENSLHLVNQDRQDMYSHDIFSLFLGVQSAPEVGPTSYETPCVMILDKTKLTFYAYGPYV